MAAIHALGVFFLVATLLGPSFVAAKAKSKIPDELKPYIASSSNKIVVKKGELYPCVCAVFLGSQVGKNGESPKGDPIVQHVHTEAFLPKGAAGNKKCTNKCMEMASKHLQNGKEILCAVVQKDIVREKAHLFIKNCEDKWVNTNLSSPKEYCCKDGSSVPCPGAGKTKK